VLTLNNIISEINLFASNHKQINSFRFGQIEQVGETSVVYPLLHCELSETSSEFNEQSDSYYFDFAIINKVNDKNQYESNLEVLSDTKLIANDFIAYLTKYDFGEFLNIDLPITLNPLVLIGEDNISGWTFTIKLVLTQGVSNCVIPIQANYDTLNSFITLNNLIDRFRTYSIDHKQINSFRFGDIEEVGETSITYPVLHCDLSDAGSEVNEQSDTFNFDFTILDKVNTRNEYQSNLEVLSDTKLIANDTVSYFKMHGFGRLLKIDLPIQYKSLSLVGEDGVSGWTFPVKLSLAQSLNYCAIPFDEPIPPPTDTYIIATGGIITRNGDYLIHTITGTDTFEVTQAGSGLYASLDYLIVAGGGGGGSFNGGGGGGGGGYLSGNFTPAVQSYAATIGAGGNGGNGGSAASGGSIGGDSSIFGLTSYGGGGGGSFFTNNVDGGSGGGQFRLTSTVGQGVAGQGNDGGETDPVDNIYNGGGGGAGAVGGNGDNSPIKNGDGGIGLQNSISGTATYYGGGGGSGATDNLGARGIGGNGGGGNGGLTLNEGGFAGTINTGGGGGGASNSGSGGNGGSGIIIVKYYSPENPFPANLLTNLISRWKLDGNSNDSIGSNNGTDTAITYSQAKINDGAVFNGTTSKIDISSVPVNYGTAYSFSFFILTKNDGTGPSGGLGGIFMDEGTFYGILNYSNLAGTSQVTFASNITTATLPNLTPNQLTFITFTINSSGVIKGYVNGVAYGSNGSLTTSISIDLFGKVSTFYLDTKIDNFCFWNGRELDATEVLQLYNYYNS
jgi:hypothetical protein